MTQSSMTPKRAAAYLVLASLLIAWLASAAGLSRAPATPQEQPQPVKTAGTESLAAEVQAQTVRLRDRLAAAPEPQEPARNPFAFVPGEAARRPPARTDLSPAPPVTAQAPTEPPLSLIGIAEDRSPTGLVRAAIITADGHELFVLKPGEVMGGRYRVAAIGADAVELNDLVTGAVRRLALR